MSIEELLTAADQLAEADLDCLVDRVILLRAHRKAPALSKEESTLLQQINQGIPRPIHERYQHLIDKRDEKTINADEYEELLELVDTVENLEAERLEALAKLATLRQISLPQVMQNLGIRSAGYA